MGFNICSMDTRVLLFAVVVSSCWCSYARDLTANHFAGERESELVSDLWSPRDNQHMEDFGKNESLCTLCEEFASDAVQYLLENKTQTEIVSILRKACTTVQPFKQQCIVLVDYYAPLLFLEATSIQPTDLCRKVDLCKDVMSISEIVSKDQCDVCHNVIAQALEKLDDPDTELEIIKMLQKACDSAGKNVKKCKKLVFEYTPILLVNMEQLLEKEDLCTILHACTSASS